MARNSRNSYGFGVSGPLPALAPTPIISIRVPATTDISYEVGTPWINTATAQAWTLTRVLAGAATWSLSSPGASDVDTLTGDGGGAISPAGGNITLAGGTNITTAGAVNTITYNLDPAITLATSVTSPLYTAGAGIDVAIDAPAGQDIIFTMGDNAAANNVSFNDLAGNPVFTVDSNGVLSNILGITIVGALTQTAGIVSIGADAAANAVDIGTGAAAKVVTIGSNNGASSLDLLAGTGNFTLDGAAATTYTIGASTTGGTIDIGGTAQTGTLTLGDSSGVNIVQIGSGEGATTVAIAGGATAAKVVTIADGAVANLVTIGTVSGAASLDLLCGTGNFTLNGVAATTYTIGAATIAGTIAIGGTAATGTMTLGDSSDTNIVEIGAGEGATTVNIAGGATNPKAVNIGIGAVANVIAIGSAAAAAITLDTAAGFSLDAATASNVTVTGAGLDLSLEGVGGAVNVTSTQTENDAIFIEASAGNGGVQIRAGTGGILIGDEADTSGITLGNIAPTAGRTIVIGSGTVVTAAVTDDISIGDGGATTNANSIKHVDINNGGVTLGEVNTFIASGDVTSGTHATEICTGNVAAGTATLDIATGTGVQTVAIATGAGPKALTLGSTNGASATVIQAGTGDITITGTVQDVTANFARITGENIIFRQSPLTGSALDTGVAATGATGDINLLTFNGGIIMEQFILGAGQTIIKPVMTATGLLISGDEVNTEGFEYNWGAARANSLHSFTIGTSPAFYLEWSFRADDISGLEPCYCGFRRTQANQAAGNIALYTDFVAYGLNDGIAPGDAAISTQLNTGGLTNTDTNDAWADGATHVLAILVDAAGNCTFTFDGGAPTATQVVQFDNGDVVHPFFRHEFNAALPDAIEWISMECGFQA